MEENRSTTDFSYSSAITYLDAIDQQRRIFSKLKGDLLSQYLEKERKPKERKARLISMNGWGDQSKRIELYHQAPHSQKHVEKIFHSDESIEKSGGFWISLGENGVVVNPGDHFLERFHKEELHIWDINHIIITEGNENASSELLTIWEFNKEINHMLSAWGMEPHIIHYWLHPDAFDRYGASIRPIYRQEQNSIHRLDLFQNSDSHETVTLSTELQLLYMANQQKKSSYAIRLEGKRSAIYDHAVALFLQTPWDALFTPLLQDAQIVVIGVGEIDFESITTLSYKEKTLGYAGALDLIASIYSTPQKSPQAILFSEYRMREGDFRIEAIKQLKVDAIRKIYEKQAVHISESNLCIIPSEESLSIDLDDFILEKAPGLGAPTSLSQIFALRLKGPFSKLQYLPKDSVL